MADWKGAGKSVALFFDRCGWELLSDGAVAADLFCHLSYSFGLHDENETQLETSLHQQLKDLYSTASSVQEDWVGDYRIDVRRGRRLIEIQTSSLGAIRDKIRALLERHPVTVVKPIVARKMLLIKDRPLGPVTARRWSPKRCNWLDLFDALTHFTTVFPHPNLTLDVPLIEIEETRFPRKARRFWHRAYRIEDQRLLQVVDHRTVRTAEDLVQLLAVTLPAAFDTKDLADALSTRRWMAQKVAYCLRQTGGIAIEGKRGNAWLYRVANQVVRSKPIRKPSTPKSRKEKGGHQAA